MSVKVVHEYGSEHAARCIYGVCNVIYGSRMSATWLGERKSTVGKPLKVYAVGIIDKLSDNPLYINRITTTLHNHLMRDRSNIYREVREDIILFLSKRGLDARTVYDEYRKEQDAFFESIRKING